jgi:hypothetical protein
MYRTRNKGLLNFLKQSDPQNDIALTTMIDELDTRREFRLYKGRLLIPPRYTEPQQLPARALRYKNRRKKEQEIRTMGLTTTSSRSTAPQQSHEFQQ